MAMIGQTNRLKICRLSEHGAYLDGGGLGDIFLPKNSVHDGAAIGQKVEAFIYPDSSGRLIATIEKPYAEVGECAFLEVVEVNDIKAFLK